MAEHQHGSMDSSVQEETFAGFITFVTRSCVALTLFAIFLAIFAT